MSDIRERLQAALLLDARYATDGEWSELLAQSENALTEITRLTAVQKMLVEVVSAVANEATVGKRGSCATRSKYATISARTYHAAIAALKAAQAE